MIRFLTDEDFSGELLRALLRLDWWVDVERVQDVGLMSRPDAEVLAYAAEHGRLLLTHDARTMPGEAYARVRDGRPMPGVFIVPQSAAFAPILASLELIVGASTAEEWDGRVVHLPHP